MKTRNLILIFGMIFLMAIMSAFASAEISSFNGVNIDKTNSLVKLHGIYSLEDTSVDNNKAGTSGTGLFPNPSVFKPATLQLDYLVQALPFDLGLDNLSNPRGQVDWCNLSIQDYISQYDGSGNPLNNFTTQYSSYYFTGVPVTSGSLYFPMRNTDIVLVDFTCHYTNPNYLYADNILVGKLTSYLPTFECVGCQSMSLQETTNLANQIDASSNLQNSIFDKIQVVVSWNYEVWLIISWIIKIGFVILGVYLVFMSGYYVYKYLNDLARAI